VILQAEIDRLSAVIELKDKEIFDLKKQLDFLRINGNGNDNDYELEILKEQHQASLSDADEARRSRDQYKIELEKAVKKYNDLIAILGK